MGIEQNRPTGSKVDDGRPMGDAGCMTGVEDTYGAGNGLNNGFTDRSSIAGGKNQRGDGIQER